VDARLEAIQTRYRNADVAARYDKIRFSDLEDAINHRSMWAALRKGLRYIPDGGRVLDIPCGTGRFTWHLARSGYRTFASDISSQMMDVARKMNPPAGSLAASFFVGDIFQLPFPDRHFDAALCIRFMNLIERPVRVRAVREMARVADVLIVSYYHKYTLKYFGRWMRHRLGLRAKRITPRLSRRMMADELAETGLKVERIVSVSPLFSEAWIAVLSHPGGGDRRCRKL
jgi:ubiquinone/menaquinone biosynthesis C-methylase UbiE